MLQFQTISSPTFAEIAAGTRLVATDVDGTLTRQGRFTPLLLESLTRLQQAGLAVVLVTGRSAGWVSALVNYLPVSGAIAENGSLYFPHADADPVLLAPIADMPTYRRALAAMFAQLQTQHPQLVAATDNPYRLTDWTFDIAGLSAADVAACADACAAEGWGFTYSTVQCHIKPFFDKADGLQQVLQRFFPAVQPHQVLTIGDSPNDESLFNAEKFPHSVGVANVKHYQGQLRHWPGFVAAGEEVMGFGEVVEKVVAGRS